MFSAVASDSGALSPGTMADDASVAGQIWPDVDNVKVFDTNYSELNVADDHSADNDVVAQLVIGGIVSGDNKANNVDISSTESYVAYGGSNDLWGLSLYPSNINANNFGFVYRILGSADYSHYLKATNFGFSIPTEAIINGILVEVRVKNDICSAWSDFNCTYVNHIRITVYYTEGGAPSSQTMVSPVILFE